MRRKRNFNDCYVFFDDINMCFFTRNIEYIKHTKKNEWTIWYVQIDPTDELYEKYTLDISSLLNYVLERDMWLDDKADEPPDIPLSESEKEYFEHTHSWGTIGPRMNTLLNILHKNNLQKELLMAKAAAGITWINSYDAIDSDMIGMRICEITRKAIWIRTYKKAYAVDSYYGRGVIYPPDRYGSTSFFINEDQESYSFDFKPRRVSLSKRCLDEIKKIQDESLKNSLIFHIPHSSIEIPKWTRNQFLLSDDELRQEHRKMIDRYTEELFDRKGYPSIIASASRLVVDVERFLDDTKEPMAKKGLGAIYKKTHDGRNLRRELDENETEELLKQYHQKNEEDVNRCINYALFANDKALLVDCHSFSSTPLPFEDDQSFPRPDICIGTDEIFTPNELVQLVSSHFCSLGYSVELNRPYQGTYASPQHYCRKQKLKSIMIEINRSLYMDEATGEKLPSFDGLYQQITLLVEKMRVYLIDGGKDSLKKSM